MQDDGLKVYRADLHMHTCLSPCGDWDMTPRAVVEKCLEKHLDIIAVTDHNSAENADAVMKIASGPGLHVFPGLEICSAEEVHLVAFFDTIEQALEMQDFVYCNLQGENNPEIFGYQVVADTEDNVVTQNPRLLIGAVSVASDALVNRIHGLGGIAVAAHIDRTAFSILGQLGFIPPDLMLDAVEVSYRTNPESAGQKFPCITSSDAHFLNEIGRVYTKFLIKTPCVSEIKMALLGENGRKFFY